MGMGMLMGGILEDLEDEDILKVKLDKKHKDFIFISGGPGSANFKVLNKPTFLELI